MGRKSTGWVEALEQQHHLSAQVLIPALLTEHGMSAVAKMAGVTEATVSRWCKAHDIVRKRVWVSKDGAS